MSTRPLTARKCFACEKGTPPLTKPEREKYLSQLKTKWQLQENGKKISREFSFQDFKAAMKFVNQIADVANSEGHHPDLYIFYNKVSVTLWTHAVGSLSENDFIMAAKIEEL